MSIDGFLADQLRRAATSVPRNFAEGCGKLTLLDDPRNPPRIDSTRVHGTGDQVRG
ncbi:MAG: four helix bundle protein [Deltaproteobacteria bacterium]|nr:four helix bundle protein [Deltaproteobacteria bacterium]